MTSTCRRPLLHCATLQYCMLCATICCNALVHVVYHADTPRGTLFAGVGDVGDTRTLVHAIILSTDILLSVVVSEYSHTTSGGRRISGPS